MKNISPRTWTLVIAAVALISLVLLAGSINHLKLSPGENFGFQQLAPKIMDQGVANDTMRWVKAIFRVILILIWILLPLYLILLIVSKEARKRLLRDMAMILPILFLLYLLSRRQATEEQADNSALFSGRMNLEELAQTPAPPPPAFTAPPSWVTTLTIVLIVVVIGLILAGLIFFLWKRARDREMEPLRSVQREAQAAIDAIQAGGDLREVIQRCYLQMIEALKEYRGIYRDHDMTPHEFELFLQKRGLPAQPVHQITELFEQVRYGAYQPGRQDEHTAISSLSAIVSACQKTRTR